MQVFIIGTALETAKVLDSKRLNKQIVECDQIFNALSGGKAWKNHPCTLQYKEHKDWLTCYKNCLLHYKKYLMHDTSEDHLGKARIWNLYALYYTPKFHNNDYFDQMKRRLFEKDEEHYKQWSYLGKSLDNWYFVDNILRIYRNGKRLK